MGLGMCFVQLWVFPSRMIVDGLPVGSMVKNPPASVGDVGLILRSGRSPGEENGNSPQYPCLGNPICRGTWQVAVLGITKSWTQFSD